MEFSTLLVDSPPTPSRHHRSEPVGLCHRVVGNQHTVEGRDRNQQVFGALDTLPVAWFQNEVICESEDTFVLRGIV